jgi:uncharacterized protein (UPF0332 family)
MVNLNWCKKQDKGIKIIEPNDNLSREYLENAEETLSVLKDIETKSNMWLATTKYYFRYFTVYALMMKIGIKCEIHDCTIKVADFLEKKKILSEGTAKKLEQDKKLRIDNQYYLKNIKVKIDEDELAEFFMKIKKIINNITREEIENIREKIMQ